MSKTQANLLKAIAGESLARNKYTFYADIARKDIREGDTVIVHRAGDVIPYVGAKSERFAAESEILLHVAARGMQIGSVRVSTIYRGEKSKINPFLDTWRFFGMLRAHRRGWRPVRPATAGKP